MMKNLTDRYVEVEYLGECPRKGSLFSCTRETDTKKIHDVVAKLNGRFTVLISHTTNK